MSDAACPVVGINVLALFKEELHALGQELAEFSPSEQECISKNIAAKIKEGWERNQAIAASINICAPGKSKNKHAMADMRTWQVDSEDEEGKRSSKLVSARDEEQAKNVWRAKYPNLALTSTIIEVILGEKFADEERNPKEDKSVFADYQLEKAFLYFYGILRTKIANGELKEPVDIRRFIKEQGYADIGADIDAFIPWLAAKGVKVFVQQDKSVFAMPGDKVYEVKYEDILTGKNRTYEIYAKSKEEALVKFARQMPDGKVLSIDDGSALMSQVQSGAVETPGIKEKGQFAEKFVWWNYRAGRIQGSVQVVSENFALQAAMEDIRKRTGENISSEEIQVTKASVGFAESPTRLPGGDYTAVQNKDGTWNILNVPIFAEVAKGDRGNSAVIGKEWMEKAVVRGQARFKARKYLAPLHVHHHDGSTKTSRAGFILPTRVEMVLHPDKPEKVPAIISDLLFVPNEAFQEIEAGRLPYRSVEVADWSRPEIASLALLPDEVPFFKFPLLTIGRKLKASAPVKFSVKSCPALASRAAGQGAFILFRFSGGSVMAKKFTDGEDRPEKKNPDAAPPWAHEMMEALKAIHKHLTETPKEKDGEKMAEDDEESKKAELELAAEPEKEEKLDALDDTPKDSYADEHTPVEQDAPKGKSKEKQEGSGYSQDVAVKLTAVTAEVAKLRAIENGRRKSAEVEGIVAGAKKDLAEHNMTEEGEVLLRDMVKHEGKAGAAKFVATWKKSVPKDPPQTAGEYFDGQGEASEFPEEVMKFAGRGPDVLAKAKQLFGDYQKLNGKCGTKVDRFIELNLI